MFSNKLVGKLVVVVGVKLLDEEDGEVGVIWHLPSGSNGEGAWSSLSFQLSSLTQIAFV